MTLYFVFNEKSCLMKIMANQFYISHLFGIMLLKHFEYYFSFNFRYPKEGKIFLKKCGSKILDN